MMITITYEQQDNLWRFTIKQDGQVRSKTDYIYPDLEVMKETVRDISAAIRKHNGKRECINEHIECDTCQ